LSQEEVDSGLTDYADLRAALRVGEALPGVPCRRILLPGSSAASSSSSHRPGAAWLSVLVVNLLAVPFVLLGTTKGTRSDDN
jgi:hypothetical protein